MQNLKFLFFVSIFLLAQSLSKSETLLAIDSPIDYYYYQDYGASAGTTEHPGVFAQEVFSWLATAFIPVGTVAVIAHRVLNGRAPLYLDVIFGLGSFFWALSGGWGFHIDSSDSFQAVFSAVNIVSVAAHGGMGIETAIAMCKEDDEGEAAQESSSEKPSDPTVDLEKGEAGTKGEEKVPVIDPVDRQRVEVAVSGGPTEAISRTKDEQKEGSIRHLDPE